MDVVPGEQAKLTGQATNGYMFYQLQLPPCIPSVALHGEKDLSRHGWLVSWSLFSYDEFSCQSDKFNSQSDEFICQQDEFNCKSVKFNCQNLLYVLLNDYNGDFKSCILKHLIVIAINKFNLIDNINK